MHPLCQYDSIASTSKLVVTTQVKAQNFNLKSPPLAIYFDLHASDNHESSTHLTTMQMTNSTKLLMTILKEFY